MDQVRTQIYLRKDQHRKLKDQSHRLGISLTELMRQALDQFLIGRQPPSTKPKGLAAITGIFSCEITDGSIRHDDYVGEAVVEDVEKKRAQRKP